MEDERVLGRSYGYVIVPEGGKTVMGVQFKAGVRAVQLDWYKLLLEYGCQQITEAEYLDALSNGVTDNGNRPGDDSADHRSAQPAARRIRAGAKRGRRRVAARTAG